MNYEHLLPSYRSRFLFLQDQLSNLSRAQELDLGLHFGCREGVFDRMLASYVGDLTVTDASDEALRLAVGRNKGIFNLRYISQGEEQLPFAEGSFDVVVVSELLETGVAPTQVISEIARVLVPGGWALLAFRSKDFPFTYDPINRLWQLTRPRSKREYGIQQGAYAFGHPALPTVQQLKLQLEQEGFEVVSIHSLGGWLVGLVEMYWTGILADVFKTNQWKWITSSKGRRASVTDAPSFVWFTDALLWLDDLWSGMLRQSVGKGMVIRKSRKNG